MITGIHQETVNSVRRTMKIPSNSIEEWRGPHQGIEYWLMRFHGKEVGWISTASVSTIQQLKKARIPHEYHEPANMWLFYKNKTRAESLKRTFRMWREGKLNWFTYTVRMGAILGYTKTQIRNFLDPSLNANLEPSATSRYKNPIPA